MALFKRNTKANTERRCVLVLSDMHAGHSFGLYDPGTVLIRTHDDGQIEEWTPEPTDTQRWIWHIYQDHIEQARDWTAGAGIVVFHGGDAVQGTRYGRLMEGVSLDDQRTIAANNLIPLLSLPNVQAVRLITGTEVHVPDSAEARIAAALAARTGIDVQSFHHHVVDVDGARFDVAHHGPYPGSRDWLKGNVALYHLKDRIYTDRRLGRQPSHVYLYGHFHEHLRVTHHEGWNGEQHTADLLVVPSYCGLGDHARKVTRSVPCLTVGMVGIEVIGGEVGEIRAFTETLDLRTEESL